MHDIVDDAELGRSLRQAYRDCPPPETFLRHELAELSATERAAVDRHVVGCPACQAERDLANEFDRAPDARPAPEVEELVDRLQTGSWKPQPAATGGGSSRWWSQRQRLVAIAASLTIAAATLLVLRSQAPTAPPLPAPAEEQVLRSSGLELVSPIGDLNEAPLDLRWSTRRDETATYDVTLETLDGRSLWRLTTTETHSVLPPTIRQQLLAGSMYRWTVTVRGDAGLPPVTADFRILAPPQP